MNVTEPLARHARTRPDHPAIEAGDRTISYAALNRRVDTAAHRLTAAGVGPGAMVGVQLPDHPDHLVVVLALLRVGAVVISVNGALTSEDRETALSKLALDRVIVTEPSEAPAGIAPLRLKALCPPDATESPAFALPDLPVGHPAVVRQSSGTTGVPKSVTWSHDFLADLVPLQVRRRGWTPDERFMQLVALSFAFARDQCLIILQLGATVVMRPSGGAAEAVQAVNDKCVSYLAATPAHLKAFLTLTRPGALLLPARPALHSTTAALSEAECRALQARVTPNLFNGYGTNEVGPITIAGPDDRARHGDCLGRTTPGIDLRIVDDGGRALPAGEVGLVCMRSAGMPQGYIGDPEATARHFRDGWFYPGDLGVLDAEGRLFLRGRADDVINNEGVKFYPIEVEQVLADHPAVAESAVLAWPHARYGQVAVACCVVGQKVSLEVLHGHCRERLAGHKVPAAFLYVEKLPKTPSGKVRKGVLAEALRHRLGPSLA